MNLFNYLYFREQYTSKKKRRSLCNCSNLMKNADEPPHAPN